jgi:general secretion pathway protein B
MSSILEALKKLEDEKAARRSGAGNIAGKVVKAGRRPKQRPVWMLPASMAAVAAIATLATYMIMGGFSTRINPVQPAPQAPTRQPQQAAPQAAAPVPLPALPPAAVPKRVLPPAPSSPVPRPPALTDAPPRQRVEPRDTGKPSAPPLPAPQPGLPALKVTGIGWQKDNAERLAIVNGRAVSEGAVVEGARVEEIFPDRVRFSFNGKTFEIPLGKISGENPLP